MHRYVPSLLNPATRSDSVSRHEPQHTYLFGSCSHCANPSLTFHHHQIFTMAFEQFEDLKTSSHRHIRLAVQIYDLKFSVRLRNPPIFVPTRNLTFYFIQKSPFLSIIKLESVLEFLGLLNRVGDIHVC